MAKLKVLYIGGFDLPDNNAAAQRVIGNSKLFRDSGFEIMLVGLTRNLTRINKTFAYNDFKYINLKYPQNYREWLTYLFSIKAYEKIISTYKPNIIIAYNHPAIALHRLQTYGCHHNVIIIGDCTEWYEPQGNFLFRIIKGLDVSLRMKIIHKRLDGLIVISDFLHQYYLNNNKPLLLLPPLVDKKELKWKLANNQSNRYCNLNPDELNIIYAGSPGKGNKDRLDIIIDALDKIKFNTNHPLKFNIIGISKDDYKRIYFKDDICIPSFVHFGGRISHFDVLCKLSQSDFQLFVRENNLVNTAGFPTKFVESISSKVLVLTNYSSDLRQYLDEGKNGFSLDITSEENLIDSLQYVFNYSPSYLRTLKGKIDSNLFDYRNYINSSNKFWQSLLY